MASIDNVNGSVLLKFSPKYNEERNFIINEKKKTNNSYTDIIMKCIKFYFENEHCRDSNNKVSIKKIVAEEVERYIYEYLKKSDKDYLTKEDFKEDLENLANITDSDILED